MCVDVMQIGVGVYCVEKNVVFVDVIVGYVLVVVLIVIDIVIIIGMVDLLGVVVDVIKILIYEFILGGEFWGGFGEGFVFIFVKNGFQFVVGELIGQYDVGL